MLAVSSQLGMFSSFSSKLQRNVKPENVTCYSIIPLSILVYQEGYYQVYGGFWGGQTTKEIKKPQPHTKRNKQPIKEF